MSAGDWWTRWLDRRVPVLPGEPSWLDLRDWPCPTCNAPSAAVEEHEEQIGYEERARPIMVTDLACGHSIERPLHGDRP